MSHRAKPPFRADHVGSLLRPKELRRARDDAAAGRISAAQLRAVEDAAIARGVKLQEEAGLQSVTDGELRRGSWHLDFYERIGGIRRRGEKIALTFQSAQGAVPYAAESLTIEDRLTLDETIFGEDFRFLKSVARATPKLTIPSPSVLHRRAGPSLANPKVYPEAEKLWADFAAIYAKEISGLAGLGCTYLQLDDTSFAMLCDPTQREALSRAGGDGERSHLAYIGVINAALKGRQAGLTVCIHTCRGNYRSSWLASGGYEFIAETLFNQLDVDGFFLEFDDERAGGFEPLRFLPKGKIVVLGLVTSKRAALESKDELKRRVDAAAKFAPLDQLCLSPQCGFSSEIDGNDLSEAEQFAKLRLVVETAREIWG
jgi:5-methyltetrahydropteroyltriglutamate--homocysteine methyltransferase